MSHRELLLHLVSWLYKVSLVSLLIVSAVVSFYGGWAIIRFVMEAVPAVAWVLGQFVSDAALLFHILVTSMIGLLGFRFMRRVHVFVLIRLNIEPVTTFDPETSLEIKRWPDNDSIDFGTNASVFLSTAVLVIAYSLVYFPTYISLSLLGSTIVLLVFSWVKILRGTRLREEDRTYYPRTKEFSSLMLSKAFGDYEQDELAENLKALIDGPDGEAARAQLRAFDEQEYNVPWDRVAMGDPEIHYGPHSREDLLEYYESMDEIADSDERLG